MRLSCCDLNVFDPGLPKDKRTSFAATLRRVLRTAAPGAGNDWFGASLNEAAYASCKASSINSGSR